MINLLEALMIIFFGLSWPVNIYKSWTSRTAKGKSLGFEVIIWIGYIFGIIRKILQLQAGGDFDWLFWLGFAFYIINIAEVTIDMILYFRNRKLDAMAVGNPT
ncbi:MAG: hypothetical protein IJV59_08260 [Eubacterium sp.]|nr:hypothetical protein [Eubacterium sp.]